MARKRTKLDTAVERTADILTKHFSKLPANEVKSMRKEIHELAVSASTEAANYAQSTASENQ